MICFYNLSGYSSKDTRSFHKKILILFINIAYLHLFQDHFELLFSKIIFTFWDRHWFIFFLELLVHNGCCDKNSTLSLRESTGFIINLEKFKLVSSFNHLYWWNKIMYIPFKSDNECLIAFVITLNCMFLTRNKNGKFNYYSHLALLHCWHLHLEPTE